MPTVEASLHLNVMVDCPYCGYFIDLLDDQDTNGYDHNEESAVLKQACPNNGHWTDAHKEFEIKDVTCSACKQTFNVKGLNW